MNLCRCHHIPNMGIFNIGNDYQWTYLIDGIYVIDENAKNICFDEYHFLWYFTKLA